MRPRPRRRRFDRSEAGGIASPSGRCSPFGADADGTVPGDGVGIVVLKRLERALSDGDTVRAVILGSAVTNDGAARATFSAPSAQGQATTIRDALAAAGVHPDEVGYVEAHGSGTRLGDPIEVEGLRRAFESKGSPDRLGCGLGSVKSNLGHLDAAAGIAGLIKAVLCTERGMLVPTLHAEQVNPLLDLHDTHFELVKTPAPWPGPAERRRIAGVSSFGIGGTNAHIVLSDARAFDRRTPRAPDTRAARGPLLFALSARTPAALRQARASLFRAVAAAHDIDVAAMAWTCAVGKCRFGARSYEILNEGAWADAGDDGAGTTAAVRDLMAIGRRWCRGDEPDWDALFTPMERRRVPTWRYPFESRWYWEPRVPTSGQARTADDGPPVQLPLATIARPASGARHVPFAGEAETALGKLFGELLGFSGIGRDDDFFSLGGDSLSGLRLLRRIEAHFGATLTLAALFQDRTVARLSQRIGDTARAPAAVGRTLRRLSDRSAPMPLSPAQQRLWFLAQYIEDPDVYNIPYAIAISGELEADAMQAAFDDVVNRHETLRTVFREIDGQPHQIVRGGQSIPLTLDDLSSNVADERDRERRLDHVLSAAAREGFDLTEGPLLRAQLVRLGSERWVLHVVTHHIVSDGWSVGVLVDDLLLAYAARRDARAPSFSSLPIQYADYAVWKQEQLRGGLADEQVAWWRDRLAQPPAPLELPMRGPRPAIQSWRGKTHTFTLGVDATARARRLAAESRATLFMVLLTAFDVLLNRYSGQDDLCVGTPTAGRDRSELEPLVGCFINTLVIRTRLKSGDTFADVLDRVREDALGAFAHQDVPFETLVDALAPVRSAQYSPLFQVMFVLQNIPLRTLSVPGLSFERLNRDAGVSKCDLAFYVEDEGDCLTVDVQYNVALFDGATIERLSEHYARLLEAACQAPKTLLTDLHAMSQRDVREVLEKSNAEAAHFPDDGVIHGLFEAQARRTPHASALVERDGRCTYAELDAWANRLAHELIASGIRRGSRIAILLAPSRSLVIAILATMKAGAAYVPLDPAHPAARLAYMADDAETTMTICDAQSAHSAPLRGVLLRIDERATAIAARPACRPSVDITPQDLAYVMFTSGSTGRPKGVLIRHQGVVNYLHDLVSSYDLDCDDRVLQLTNASFDPSVREIFGTLAAGATLHLLSAIEARAPDAVLRAIQSWRLTAILGITPSFVEMLGALPADAPGSEPPEATLRLVLVSGERLANSHVEVLRRLSGPRFRIVNQYGPTEISMIAARWPVRTSDEPIPIGHPLPNVSVYVLDPAGRLVPYGAPGELCIGGAGLAWGYARAPGMTAERFVPDPFGGSGKRLYRTGDICRFDSEGRLQYLGRSDDQVKLRGHRIELQEVRRALLTMRDVVQAAATVRDDVPGGPALVAYIVVSKSASQPPTLSSMRIALRSELPEPMVPTMLVVMDQLPRTVNQKLDRAALPRPAVVQAPEPSTTAHGEPPEGTLENQVLQVWRRVMERPGLTVDCDFFDQGGHSLLAARLAGAHGRELGLKVSLLDLFRARDVSRLCALLRSRGQAVSS
jgi:amino acid adenylation domain-containing protein